MAGNPKDQQTQLDINTQINKILSDRTAILSAQEKALSSQVQLAVDLCKALKCEQLDEIEERLKTARDEMQRAAEAAKNYGGALSSAADTATRANDKTVRSVTDLWKAFKELNPAVAGAVTGLGVGFVRGVGSAFQTTKNLITGIGGIISTLGNLAFTIIGLPFRLLEGLFDLAQSGGGGPSPLLVEIENIRKQFGNLKTNEGAAALGALDNLRKGFTNLAGTGLSIRRVFGPGLEGLAKALAENNEVAKELGASFNSLLDIIKDFPAELAVFRKGMGFTAAQQAMLMKTTKFMGGNVMNRMQQIGSMAIRLGRQFGVNSKVLTQSIGQMIEDFPHFGSMGVKAMGQIATYASKLGIEIKDLTGMIDAFDDFEDAATRTAKLAQSFQLNLDTMKMLDEQDPAARLYQFQKAWRETGRSYESLNRVEKKQLATLTNLPDAAIAAAIGQNGLTKSYEDVQKAGAKAEKQQMSQQEVLNNLAKSIERVFGSGGGSKFKGFFDAFTSGFRSGIMRSRAFRQAMRAIRRSLRVVYFAGRQVGRMFVDMFPGVKKIFVGIKDIFNPRRFYGFMQDIKKAFAKLFVDLRTDPKAGIERFLKTFREKLVNFFKSSGPAAKGFLAGGKEFLGTMWSIFKVLFAMVVDGLASAARAVTEFLKNPPDIVSPIGQALKGLGDALRPLFSVIAEKLWPALAEMFTIMWQKAKPTVTQWGKYILYAGLLKIFVQSLFGAAVGAIGAAGGKILAFGATKIFGSIFGIAGLGDKAKKAAAATKGLDPQSAGGFKNFFGYLGVILAAAIALIFVYKAANMKPEDALALSALLGTIIGSSLVLSKAVRALPPGTLFKSYGPKLLALGAFMVIIGGIAVGFVSMLSGIDTGNLSATAPAFMAVMAGLVMSTIPLLIAAAIIGHLKSQTTQALIGMGIVALFMGAIGYVATSIIENLAEIKFNNASATEVAALLTAIGVVMLAVIPIIGISMLLGALAMSKIGWVGIAVVAAGFAIVSLLVKSLVESFIPTIKELAAINVPNPTGLNAVIAAFEVIAGSMTKFVGAAALLAFSLDTGEDISPEEFRKNMDQMGKLVTTIITSGIGKIMNDLMTFARTANIKEGTGEVISAIGSGLSGAAALASAFGPNEAAGQAIVDISTSFFSEEEDVDKMIKHIETAMPLMRQTAVEVLPVLGKALSDIIKSLSGVSISEDVKNIGPIIGAMGSIFTAVAALMNAMSPSDASWKMLSETMTAVFITSGNQQVMYNLFQADRNARVRNMPILMGNMRDLAIDIIKGIKGPISELATSLAGVSTENLKITIPLITSILDFSSKLISNVGPAISAASAASEGAPEGQKTEKFRAALSGIVWAMSQIGPILQTLVEPMKQMISGVISVAKNITDTRGLKAKIEVVTAAIEAVGAMTALFGPGGSLTAVNEQGAIQESMITNIKSVMNLVTNNLLTVGGPLETMAKQLSKLALGDTRKIKSNAEAVKKISDGAGEIASAFAPGSGLVTFGAATFELEGIWSKILMFTVGGGAGIFQGMKLVIDQVPESIADRSESISNMIRSINSISTALQETTLGADDLSALVTLNNALTGKGTLKVEHKNVEITMNVHVQMSAEQIANGIIKVNDVFNGKHGKQKFMLEDVK